VSIPKSAAVRDEDTFIVDPFVGVGKYHHFGHEDHVAGNPRRPVSGPKGTRELGNPRASKITIGAAGVNETPRLRVAGSLVDSTSAVRGFPAENHQLYGSHPQVNLDVDPETRSPSYLISA
jgi:hypothetical protein